VVEYGDMAYPLALNTDKFLTGGVMDAPDLTVRTAMNKLAWGMPISQKEAQRITQRQGLEQQSINVAQEAAQKQAMMGMSGVNVGSYAGSMFSTPRSYTAAQPNQEAVADLLLKQRFGSFEQGQLRGTVNPREMTKYMGGTPQEIQTIQRFDDKSGTVVPAINIAGVNFPATAAQRDAMGLKPGQPIPTPTAVPSLVTTKPRTASVGPMSQVAPEAYGLGESTVSTSRRSGTIVPFTPSLPKEESPFSPAPYNEKSLDEITSPFQPVQERSMGDIINEVRNLPSPFSPAPYSEKELRGPFSPAPQSNAEAVNPFTPAPYTQDQRMAQAQRYIAESEAMNKAVAPSAAATSAPALSSLLGLKGIESIVPRMPEAYSPAQQAQSVPSVPQAAPSTQVVSAVPQMGQPQLSPALAQILGRAQGQAQQQSVYQPSIYPAGSALTAMTPAQASLAQQQAHLGFQQQEFSARQAQEARKNAVGYVASLIASGQPIPQGVNIPQDVMSLAIVEANEMKKKGQYSQEFVDPTTGQVYKKTFTPGEAASVIPVYGPGGSPQQQAEAERLKTRAATEEKTISDLSTQIFSNVEKHTAAMDETRRAREMISQGALQGAGAAGKLKIMQAVNTIIPNLFDTSKSEVLNQTYQSMALSASNRMKGQGQITENERKLLADTVARLGNSPEAALYIMDFADAVSRRELARAEYLSGEQKAGRRPTQAQLTADFYKANSIDRFMQKTDLNQLMASGQQAMKDMSAQDRQALEWANKNPQDPRAAQIRNRLKR